MNITNIFQCDLYNANNEFYEDAYNVEIFISIKTIFIFENRTLWLFVYVYIILNLFPTSYQDLTKRFYAATAHSSPLLCHGFWANWPIDSKFV